MKKTVGLLAALLLATNCPAQSFVATSLSPDGRELVLKRADGGMAGAPKFGEQDSFLKPAIAPDGRSVGWLALYPGFGASYSQPLNVVVLDDANRVRRFAGDFGMVYGWCFADGGAAVVLTYRFPHGISPVGYDKRRLRDGRLLARRRIEPVTAPEEEAGLLRSRTPAWASCALSNANASAP